jgi:hypothetical protein
MIAVLTDHGSGGFLPIRSSICPAGTAGFAKPCFANPNPIKVVINAIAAGAGFATSPWLIVGSMPVKSAL